MAEHTAQDTAPASITAGLGRFASDFKDPPQAALDTARMGVVDAIGLMLAARNEPVVASVRQVLSEDASGGQASIVLSAARTRPADAAFINATAAHAFAMDDVAWGCHPSAMLFPALFACGEALHASGAALLRAWIVGYEVLAELASREPDSLHPTGWHPTGLLGPVAVAAAVGNLRQLSGEQAARALGIAASMGGGLSVNFGTQTKALHLGRVAQAGILAVDFAQAGVTASADALERPSGLLRTISPRKAADIGRPVDIRADRLRVLSAGISIKKYPLCYSVHRVADAAIDISSRAGFDATQVRRIDVAIGRRQAQMARYLQPSSALEAKYSVPFAVASGLVASAAGFAQLTPEFMGSDGVRRLVAMTQVELLDDVNPDDPVFSRADRVCVTLQDGRVLDSGEVLFERGHARLPIGSAQLRDKFLDCASSGGMADARSFYEYLSGLDAVADVADIAVFAQRCMPARA